jgi:hypothetical protein
MLKIINDLPPPVIGIHAFQEVTDAEYEDMLVPLLKEQVKRHKRINFVLVLETDIKNFASGAWCGSVKIGLKYFFKWKKVAIVTDQKGIGGYSDLFKYIIPGKFCTYQLNDLDKALRWVTEK